MVNRPAGGARSQKHLRSPLDWYREPPRAVQQLLHGVDFGDDLIWDGCCGGGTVLDVAADYGHLTVGSDLAERGAAHPFIKGNILEFQKPPFKIPQGQTLSYISNPPYGYSKDIAERIIRHVLTVFPVRRAAFLVPIAFLASEGRHRLFTRDFRPSQIAILSDRITCPPGHLIDQMSKPYEGGMADYVWVCFCRPHRWRTETLWLAPGPHPYPPRRNPTGDKNG